MSDTKVNYVGGSFVVLLILMLSACDIGVRLGNLNQKLERIAVALEKTK